MYEVIVEARAQKFIKSLSSQNYLLVSAAIESIRENPYRPGIKKLKGHKDKFRIRAGNFRILYEINGRELIITIVAIGDRKDIYD